MLQAVAVANVLVAILLVYFGHQKVILLLAQWYDLEGDAFSKLEVLIHPFVYSLWIVFHCFIALTLLLFDSYLKKHPELIVEKILFIQTLIRALFEAWKSLNAYWKYLFVAFVMGYTGFQVYKISITPLIEDEMASLSYFISKGPAVILSYYPGPNNHVFYNLCAWFFYALGIADIWAIRLPSITITVIGIIVVFLSLKKVLSAGVCFLGVLGFSCYPHFFHYSHLGRGYAMSIVWIVLMCISFFFFLRDKKALSLFNLGLFFGFLSIITLPSSTLYFGLAILLVVLLYRKFHWLLYRNIVVTIGLSIIFYIPIFLFQGLGAITSNPWALSYQKAFQDTALVEYLKETAGYLSFVEIPLLWPLAHLIVVLYSIAVLHRSQLQILFSAVFINLAAPYVFTVLIQSHAPFRVWILHGCVLSFLITLLLGISIQKYFMKKSNYC